MADREMQQLHVRFVKGEQLTEEERRTLDAWYARMDSEEATILADKPDKATITVLETQIQAMIAQMAATSQRIRETMQQNAQLRQEVVALQHQLARQISDRAA